jgi:hypothetical protein
MSESEPQRPSQPLLELIFYALRHGCESVRAGGGLVPFLLTTGAGRPTLQRFVADSLDRSREMAREAADALPDSVERYAIALDGFLRDGNKHQEAIVVEAGERSQPTAFQFAQAYRWPVGGELEKLGRPTYAGETPNRLK